MVRRIKKNKSSVPDAVVKTAEEVLADQISCTVGLQNLLERNGVGDVGKNVAFLYSMRNKRLTDKYLSSMNLAFDVGSIEALYKWSAPLSFLAIRLSEYPDSGLTNILTTTVPSLWRPLIVFMNLALPRLS